MDWLTTVLAEDALGGPAALRRSPLQAAAGTAVKLVNLPVCWSTRGLDRALDTVRAAPPALGGLFAQGARASDVAVKTLTAFCDAALETAEHVTRREGADTAAHAFRSIRTTTNVLEPGELPINDYDELDVDQAVAEVKELTDSADIRAIVAYVVGAQWAIGLVGRDAISEGALHDRGRQAGVAGGGDDGVDCPPQRRSSDEVFSVGFPAQIRRRGCPIAGFPS